MRFLAALVVVLTVAVGVLGHGYWDLRDQVREAKVDPVSATTTTTDGRLVARLADIELRLDELDRETVRTPGAVPALEAEVAVLRAEVDALRTQPRPQTVVTSPDLSGRVSLLESSLNRLSRCVSAMRKGDQSLQGYSCPGY